MFLLGYSGTKEARLAFFTPMTNLKTLVPLIAIPVLVVAWALFRPERLFIDQRVNEAAPDSASAQTLLSGSFTSDAHETKGTAEIIAIDGKKVLRLSNFATSNGPDVRVLLVSGTDASTGEVVKRAETIDLGAIKGNIGDQNYVLPDDFDPERFRAVSIWCKRFGVNFGGATLTGA